MNGPITNDREKLGNAIHWLERGLVFAGGIVVIGLLMESGPEIVASLRKHELPSRQSMGAVLVTIGVAAEVIFAALIAQKSGRVQEISNILIAESNERAAQAIERADKAELAAAEVNLELARLEAKFTPRYLFNAQRFGLAENLSSAEVKSVDMFVHGNGAELVRFSAQIAQTIIDAGWNLSSWTLIGREALVGIFVSVAGTADAQAARSAKLLHDSLAAFDLDVIDAIASHRNGVVQESILIPPPDRDPTPTSSIRLHVGDRTWKSSKPRPATPPQA